MKKKMNSFKNKIDYLFKVSEHNTTISKEIVCGLISFLPMIYILPLISVILSNIGMNTSGVFLASALSSALACILVGLLMNKPAIQSIGLGMNAFFVYTICGSMGYNWQEGIAIIFVSSLLFLIMSITPLRKKIIISIPKDIQKAISIGLGGFLICSGLQSAGIIVNNSLGNLKLPVVLLTISGIIITIILINLKGKIKTYGIILGILIVAIVSYFLHLLGVENMPTFHKEIIDFKALKDTSFGFLHGFKAFNNPKTYFLVFIFTFMNIFDTSTGLLTFAKDLGLSDEFGEINIPNRILLPDSISSVLGIALGTTPITTFAETKISIESGAKTGISSIVVGIMFLLSIFLYPIFSIFSGVEIDGINYNPMTSIGVVSIGVLLLKGLKDVNWKDFIAAIVTIVTLVAMILLYSIPNGLGIGLIVYVLLLLIFKRTKEVPLSIYIITVFFIIYFITILIL